MATSGDWLGANVRGAWDGESVGSSEMGEGVGPDEMGAFEGVELGESVPKVGEYVPHG